MTVCRSWLYYIALFCSVVISSGCSPDILGWSGESYRAADFKIESINQSGLAILPVIVLEQPSKKTGKQSIAPSAPYTVEEDPAKGGTDKLFSSTDAFSVSLTEVLLGRVQERALSLQLVSPYESLKRLNNAGLTTAYRNFYREFPTIGFNDTLLSAFGNALDCRYILISQAIFSESTPESSLTFVWSFGRKSMVSSVKISSQIWDIKQGIQLWEGSGVGYSRLLGFEDAPLMEEISNTAVDHLLDAITQKPLRTPPRPLSNDFL